MLIPLYCLSVSDRRMHSGKDVEAMRSVGEAYQDRSLQALQVGGLGMHRCYEACA